MALTEYVPPLKERVDTPMMRRMLEEIRNRQAGSGVELRVADLSRKLGLPRETVLPMVTVAENCGWVELKTCAVRAVHGIKLTESGWELVGGKPLWMRLAA